MEYQIIQSSTVKDPLISVIVPMYNVEKYIETTIQSLLNQTIVEIEIILIDDGSCDETVDVVKGAIKGRQNVILVVKENSGPGASRNLGLKLSSGKYISFVDSDDYLPEKALESMHRAAVEKKVDLVTGMSQSFNTSKKWLINSHVNAGAYEEGMKDLYHHPGMLYTVGPCNKLFKRDLLYGMEFPTHIKVAEDHPFIIESYLKAGTFYTLDKIIYYYRQREDVKNTSLSQIVHSNSVSVVQDIMNSLKISDELWGKYESDLRRKKQMQLNYYSRIIRADLWPAILRTITSKKTDDLEEIFTMLEVWIKEMDVELLRNATSISRMLIFQLHNNYLSLPKEIKIKFHSILKIYTEKVKPGKMVKLNVLLLYIRYFCSSLYNKILLTVNKVIKNV